MRRIALRTVAVTMVALGTVSAGASLASATKADPDHKVTICHATASKSNPYVEITVDIASILGDSGHGHSGVNIGDIIPPISVDGSVAYAGHNLDSGQAILDNHCNIPSDTTTGFLSAERRRAVSDGTAPWLF